MYPRYETTIVCSPEGALGIENAPFRSVAVPMFVPLIVTFAPGSASFESLSKTFPLMFPLAMSDGAMRKKEIPAIKRDLPLNQLARRSIQGVFAMIL